MIKNTIAIAALLGSIDASTLSAMTKQQEAKGLKDVVDVSQLPPGRVEKKKDKTDPDPESDGEDEEKDDSEEENLAQQTDSDSDAEPDSDKTEEQDDNEKLQLGEASTVRKMSASCHDGVKRWGGKSNTWKTFDDAHSADGLYKDDTFKPSATALGSSRKYSFVKAWKRPTEMEKDSAPSFWGPKGKPVPQGIKQGSLGDCWFLAAASAIAEVPDRMKRVAWNDSYDKKGAFRFYFWVKNKWHGINIDDRLPARKGYYGYQAAFVQKSTLGAYWMPLLEKAYAKLDQNYERIVGGMGFEGLRTLTGMPTTYFSLKKGKDLDNTYKLMKRLADKNYPMTTPCCNNGNFNGLITGHAYTLLNVLQLSTGEKLAHVRNPWSQGEWKGDWSDKSSKWTAATKKEAGYVNANDGAFFMPFKAYTENYWGASVALYQEYKGYQVMDFQQSVRTVKITVNNPIEQELYIVGETWSNRNYPRNCNPGNNYVMYLFDSNMKRVGSYAFIGARGFGMSGKLGEKMPKGDYTVYLINQSYRSQTAMLSLNFYWADKKGSAAEKKI